MIEQKQNLGKLESVHGISPVFLQRAAFIAVLSFVFFLAMMVGFYIRQSIVYFLLASAFLLIYLFTLFSWLMQKRNQLRIFENGFTYKKQACRWDEIDDIKHREIRKTNGEKIILSEAIQDIEEIINMIKRVSTRRGS